jgi:hypothetical protein
MSNKNQSSQDSKEQLAQQNEQTASRSAAAKGDKKLDGPNRPAT